LIRFFLILLGFALIALQAQAQNESASDRSRRALDAAMSRARAQAAENAKTKTMPQERPSVVPIQTMNQMQGVDPGELADQYKVLAKAQKPAHPDLLIFASASMPISTLVRLGQQVKEAGGIMVFRGIKGGLSKKALNEWLGLLKPVVETGASMQIDPESFAKYNVTAVPTFVLIAAPENDCGDTHCAVNAAALTGDVSLDYALEKFSARGGRYGEIADSYLGKLTKR